MIALLVVFVFFLLSMFFSGMETGMLTIDRFQLESDSKDDHKKRKVFIFLEDPHKFMGVTLIGNNIAAVVVSILVTVYFGPIFKWDKTVSTLLLAGFMLIFAEIIPKSYCRDRANTLVSKSFNLLFFFYLILKPFIGIVNLISSVLAKLFNIDTNNPYSFLTRDDLAIILSETPLEDGIEQPQKEMLEEVMEFNQLTAKNVMTPRLDIVAISEDTPIPDIIVTAQKEGYTRYPVYTDNIDNVTGIIIIYDLIKHDNTGTQASDLVREALYVPETIDINTLLREMKKQKKSMAIVVDNYGGTAGLITSEDILEELVGEIEDEYDLEQPDEDDVEVINDKILIAKGEVEIDYLNDEHYLDLPEGDYETLAGLIIDTIMKIPVKGQIIDAGNCRLEVLETTHTKIIKVKITKISH